VTDAIDRCNCTDWKEGMSYIISLENFARSHGIIDNDYKGKFMQYCAWCGKKLKD
jgi:hypothetical protein